MNEKRTIKQQVPEPHMTQDEVGKELGLKRFAVAKLEADALKKLKRRLEEQGYDKSSFF
jgi:DNA-directed RNA polymerase specialized sigma subunit